MQLGQPLNHQRRSLRQLGAGKRGNGPSVRQAFKQQCPPSDLRRRQLREQLRRCGAAARQPLRTPPFPSAAAPMPPA